MLRRSLLGLTPVRPVYDGSRIERRAVGKKRPEGEEKREKREVWWASGREINESGRLFAEATEGAHQEVKERPAEMHPSHVQLRRVE